jgi:hypothetical protein
LAQIGGPARLAFHGVDRIFPGTLTSARKFRLEATSAEALRSSITDLV